MPLIQSLIIEKNGWLSLEEFTDIITIAEMTPGPVAINSATFVGIKIAGVLGAITSTIGFILPSFIIVLILAFFYYKYKNLEYVKGVLFYLKPGIVSIIASAGLSILLLAILLDTSSGFSISNIDYINLLIFLLGFILLRKLDLNPVVIILGSGVLGLLLSIVI